MIIKCYTYYLLIFITIVMHNSTTKENTIFFNPMKTTSEWTVVNRQRTLKSDKWWDHEGVTTMFVSNIPNGANKETIWKMFNKYGELTDVYMATK